MTTKPLVRCAMATGGNARWAGRCDRRAVGLFYTSADDKPMPLCTQHKKIWATGQAIPRGLDNYVEPPKPKVTQVRGVTPLEAVRRLLDDTLANLTDRDLQEAMPHVFFVAMGVAEYGVVTEEARRLLHLDEEK